MQNNWMQAAEAAEMLGLAERRLIELARLGRVPRPLTIDPAAPLWSRAEVSAYLAGLDAHRRAQMARDGFADIVAAAVSA